MRLEDVLDVLDRLDAGGIEWWLDGGWGVDALLGVQTREHDDVDLAVRLEDIERLPAVFPEFERIQEEDWPGAYVLRDAQGRKLDFHPLVLDERGDGHQPQPGGGTALWPREALGARGRIDDRKVRCTSPEFQLASHRYEGHDDVDWQDMQALAERFGLELPEPAPPGFLHPKRLR